MKVLEDCCCRNMGVENEKATWVAQECRKSLEDMLGITGTCNSFLGRP